MTVRTGGLPGYPHIDGTRAGGTAVPVRRDRARPPVPSQRRAPADDTDAWLQHGACGTVVPELADIRLLEATGLEYDESVLDQAVAAGGQAGHRGAAGAPPAELSGYALMGAEFQVRLRRFSMLLVYVAGALTTSIFLGLTRWAQPAVEGRNG